MRNGRQGGLDLSTRLMLALLNRQTRGGMVPADIEALRARTDRAVLPLWVPRRRIASVEEQAVPGAAGPLRVRIYRPREPAAGAVLFLHGGGFVHCGLDSHDGICCELTRRSGSIVVSLDYRLAPDHRFPAAVEDAYAALRWLADHAGALGVDPRRIAVAGDSAGGNLAAVVALLARDRGGPSLAFQLLYYPTTHGLDDVPSRHLYADGYFLTTSLMRWYLDQYIDAEHHYDSPYFAPHRAPDLSGLPPALVVTAEFDPLRDEGAGYAERLRAAGVDARYICHRGVIHAFLNFYPMQAKGRRALQEGAAALRAALVA